MTDRIVTCTFRDNESFRDLADALVEQQPDVFPNRASVFRKGFHLLIATLKLDSDKRVAEPPLG
jgi:hypothetical protein